MKRAVIWTAAVALVLAIALPASALENEFGGYWRTRFYTNQNFSGTDEETVTTSTSYSLNTRTGTIDPKVTVSDNSKDLSQVDTRTRLYYTAKINDSLKLVNKFEMDAVWGGPRAGYGDVGADGKDIEIKNTYADFLLGMANFRVGIQPFVVSRGFTFDDDAAGAIGLFKFSDAFTLGAAWIRWNEGYSNSVDRNDKRNDEDVDGALIAPTFSIGKDIKLTPSVLYVFTDDIGYERLPAGFRNGADLWWIALDGDMKFGPAKLWFSAIYNTGTLDSKLADADLDVSSYLAAVGAKFDITPMVDIHGEFAYASGDDDATDGDIDAFINPPGASHYWSEIMGLGLFDVQATSGAPADQISNVMYAGLGATIKPMNKLALTFDVWYAELAEDNVNGDSELGTELDLRITYELLQGLKLDVVGAYLFAGDATYSGANDEDPYEIGTQLSLSF